MPSHNRMHLPGRPGPGLGAGINPDVLYGLVFDLLGVNGSGRQT